MFLNLDGSRLDHDVRQRHAAMIAAAQRPEGGFPGRRGPCDLYYTGFALQGLALLGRLDEPVAHRAGEFLESRIGHPMPAADFFSLVVGSLLVELATGVDPFAAKGHSRQRAVVDFFAPLRRDDGGYAKTERGTSSTYQTFLVVLARQLVGASLDDGPAIERMVRSRQRDDGGFVEVESMDHSGTNPTAAAIGTLLALDTIDPPTRTAATQFLATMQTAEGGLRANTRVPVADLLSTFTGLLTLANLDTVLAVDLAAVRRFVLALEQPDGGFRAGAWDDQADIEYTFYGVATLALLASQSQPEASARHSEKED